MKKKVILLTTSNPQKLLEISAILGPTFYYLALEEITQEPREIQSVSAEEVAREKVAAYQRAIAHHLDRLSLHTDTGREKLSSLDYLLVVEDTGLGFEKMGTYQGEWLPGAFIKYIYDGMGDQRIIEKFGDSSAIATCALGIYDAATQEIDTLVAKVPMMLVKESQEISKKGYNYDKITRIADTTIGEMTKEEKNKVSPRGKVIKQFQDYLHHKEISPIHPSRENKLSISA